MGKYSYESYSKSEQTTTTYTKKEFPRVGYLILNEKKPTAIVRFDVESEKDLTIVDVHNVKVGKSWRNVACLRNDDKEPWANCPLCEHDIKSRSTKVFVRMIEYSTVEGKVVATPVVWTRYAGFADELVSHLTDYGDLREVLFKVTWSKDNNRTKYTVKPLIDKTGMYSEECGYVKDFSAFKNFLVNKHSYMERTFDELKAYVETGEMASRKPVTEDTAIAKETASAVRLPAEEVSATTEMTMPAEKVAEVVEQPVARKPVAETVAQDSPLDTPRRRRYDFPDDDGAPQFN